MAARVKQATFAVPALEELEKANVIFEESTHPVAIHGVVRLCGIFYPTTDYIPLPRHCFSVSTKRQRLRLLGSLPVLKVTYAQEAPKLNHRPQITRVASQYRTSKMRTRTEMNSLSSAGLLVVLARLIHLLAYLQLLLLYLEGLQTFILRLPAT